MDLWFSEQSCSKVRRHSNLCVIWRQQTTSQWSDEQRTAITQHLNQRYHIKVLLSIGKVYKKCCVCVCVWESNNSMCCNYKCTTIPQTPLSHTQPWLLCSSQSHVLASHSGICSTPLSACRFCLPWPRVSSFTTSTCDSPPFFCYRLPVLYAFPPYQLKRKYIFLLFTQCSSAAVCVS